jgi:sarcosine oxidase, subunit alpha
MMHRVARQPGEWLDRESGGTFRFEGREIRFVEGDTYSTALAAAGLMVLARSFKYHRPRGLFSAANFDANVLFDIDGRPNQRGDVLRARDGAVVEPCNVAGSVLRDRGAFIGALSRFLPVGFYYKTFISRRWFPLFERVIRRVSGLGRITVNARATQPMHRHLHCDVAVIGAGISGLEAAMAAASAGADRIVLVDEGLQPGGCSLHGAAADPARRTAVAELRARLAATTNIVSLQGHCVCASASPT